MYHGAPRWGCLGSVISDADCVYTLKAHRMTRAAWTIADKSGTQMCIMNRTALTRSKKVESIEMTTLKEVTLNRSW